MLSNKSFVAVLIPAMIAGTIALVINWRIHRDMDGVAWWPAGLGVSVLGAVLRSMEGDLPDGIAILLGDFCLVGGQLIVVAGLCKFAGRPISLTASVLTLVALIAGVTYFTWIDAAPVTRTVVFSVILGLTFIIQAPSLLSLGRQEGFAGVVVLTGVYGAGVVLLGYRAVLMISSGAPPLDLGSDTLRSPDQLNQVVGFIYATVLVILRAYGYILLASNRVQARLRQTATVDALTGVPNRRAFDEEIRRLAPRVRRDRICYGLAVLDIDFFKRINDTHGHVTGDRMLRHFSTVARGVLRDSDFFARVGGEEFVLVVADTTPTAFRQAAERIRQAFEKSGLPLSKGELKATVSAGLAISVPGEMDQDALYARADAALYRAKAGGRNRVELDAQPAPTVFEPVTS